LVVFKELPKVNNRPMGENSPNLVTLVERDFLQNYTLCRSTNTCLILTALAENLTTMAIISNAIKLRPGGVA
jgi:hypothetical protein